MRSLRDNQRAERDRVQSLLARDHSDDLIPPEVLVQGDYAEVTVVDEATGSQATVRRNRKSNLIFDLWERGALSPEQYAAALEIARVHEIIGRAVGMRSASLEARVDNSGSGKDMLVEHLYLVRLEQTYRRWRLHLPGPKRMMFDLIVDGKPLIVVARRYGMRRPTVRNRLCDALDRWNSVRERVDELVDREEVEAAHLRAGGGILA